MKIQLDHLMIFNDMYYAIDRLTGKKITAYPGADAVCPGCSEVVVPKCGVINIYHFAHAKGSDCDDWHESETIWHRKWKSLFPIEEQEVVWGIHRADVRTKSGLVIEFQNSTISAEEIIEREEYYGNMIWVVNGSDFFHNISTELKDGYWSFKWKHARKCWLYAKRPIYMDIGGTRIFHIKKIYPSFWGWGYHIEYESLLRNHRLFEVLKKMEAEYLSYDPQNNNMNN